MRAILILALATQGESEPQPKIPPLPTEGDFASQLVRKNEATLPMLVSERLLLPADTRQMREMLPAGDDLVIGIEVEGEARAYPIKLINNDDVMNDMVHGRAVLATWCQACQTAMVYGRALADQALTIGNTHATYLGTAVFYDVETRSFWTQANGKCVFGPSLGKSLEPLVARLAMWDDWKRTHPKTLVVGGTIPAGERRSRFPLFSASGKDLSRVGVVVRNGPSACLYRADAFTEIGAVSDELGGVPLIVVLDGPRRVMQAWKRTVGEKTLEFDLLGRGSNGPLVLAERGGERRWDAADGHPLVAACAKIALTPISCQSIRTSRFAALFPAGSVFGKGAN